MSPPDHVGEFAALTLRGVSAARNGHTIWSGADFEVPPGGIVAVIGPNGSGKTTLLQVVLGLIPAASGHVEVFGEPPGAVNDKIGYVPQNYASTSDEAIRVRDAVMLGRNGHRWGLGWVDRSDRRHVDEALAAVDAGALGDRRVSQLSGGQRQRVALAAALAGQPRMLILDEPLASLDLGNQREIVALLARINNERGVTILVVAHDLNPLRRVLTSAIYLKDGRVGYEELDGSMDGDLLTHLYGAPIEIAHPHGDQVMRGGNR